ncbi:hypothetical protein CHCC15075_1926 [Bacillus licheniformis]|uniref:Uncharacterized protein n=1 Tax=Bacillus licheniformis TaxID=1402 RepID=A0A8B5Y8I1_BACLI|nr:hypothetical protein B4092_2953 [Bacillus licheniformis]KYC76293.1 hypothetical protein B4090_2979 [Bacillus licheniformis]KYC80975.1 hypothetical protein B4091_2994 [Bacillus licheniformis]KYC96402.1 hypothetical protein B4164_2847 [Bacillus licheniformis]TWJ70274.1 hypothetical protein CHCC5020_0323 [Bacillus licheniformis]
MSLMNLSFKIYDEIFFGIFGIVITIDLSTGEKVKKKKRK